MLGSDVKPSRAAQKELQGRGSEFVEGIGGTVRWCCAGDSRRRAPAAVLQVPGRWALRQMQLGFRGAERGRDDDVIFSWGKVAGNQVYVAATALLSGRAEQSRGTNSGSRLMRVRALFLKRENWRGRDGCSCAARRRIAV